MDDLGDDWLVREEASGDEALAPAAVQPAATLLVVSGYPMGLTYRIEQRRVMVGRHPACDLMIQGSGVSRRHFELRKRPDNTVTILDLNSTNGTYVAGERIRGETPLGDGQEIRIGARTVLKFQA